MTTSDVGPFTDAIVDEWDALADRLGATPFSRPGWFDAWLTAFAPDSPTLATAHRNGELVGVMPLARRNNALSSLTNWHTPRFEPLAVDADAARSLASAALRARRLSLSFVEAEAETTAAIVAEAAERGYVVHRRAAEASPEVEVTGSWDDYLPTISKNMRREFRRRQKRLAEAGTFAFEVHESADDLAQLVEEAFAVEAASWKGQSGTAVIADPVTLDFYQRVASWAGARGWLRICLMRLDGRPIASDFALESERIFYSLKGGYDPGYAEYSPGRLMDGLEIQRAHELGLRRFEFGGDPEHHKLQWRPRFRQLEYLDAFAPTLGGRLERLVVVEGGEAARRLRASARKLRKR